MVVAICLSLPLPSCFLGLSGWFFSRWCFLSGPLLLLYQQCPASLTIFSVQKLSSWSQDCRGAFLIIIALFSLVSPSFLLWLPLLYSGISVVLYYFRILLSVFNILSHSVLFLSSVILCFLFWSCFSSCLIWFCLSYR